MTDEDVKKSEPAYAPDEQAIIPGYKKYISVKPKDWRKWEDGRGNKVDAPGYRGAQFTGKIVPPLTDPHGQPYRDGQLQLVRDARGVLRVIDWSLSVSKDAVMDDEDGRTPPLMGRCVYETRHSLERALLAMSILAQRSRDKAAGLPEDPVQCKDLAGKPIFVGKLVLARYARGRFPGQLVIVDTALDIAAPARRIVLKKDTTLKQAVALLRKQAAGRKVAPAVARKKFVAAGPPITFSAPEGFGGLGGGGAQDRECPTPDSKSWDVTVDLYARTGKWCQTARLIWAGQYPAELVEQCENYRQEFLDDPSKFYDYPAETENDEYRETLESHAVVRMILECFEGSAVIDRPANDEEEA
jgi:hypothetical protein